MQNSDRRLSVFPSSKLDPMKRGVFGSPYRNVVESWLPQSNSLQCRLNGDAGIQKHSAKGSTDQNSLIIGVLPRT